MINIIRKARTQDLNYRITKVKANNRLKHYLIFIDFKKAFDMVKRKLLLEKLEDMGIDPETVLAMQTLFNGT